MSPATHPADDPATAAGDTKTRLLYAALQTVREDGLAHTSARTVAARAQANQALIFYHFHTVSELLEAASNHAVDHSIQRYRADFAGITSLDGLASIGRELYDRERAIGNVAVMAQMLSGAQHDPVLARATRYAMSAWNREVTTVLDRVLHDSPMAGLVDVEGLAHLVTAGFIGIELCDGADHAGAAKALTALETLGRLVDTLNSLGPITRL